MPAAANHIVLWFKRKDAPELTDETLRFRANVDDSVEVRIVALGRLGRYTLPVGARDESGTVLDYVLNVDDVTLGPEGRVYVIDAEL